MKRNVKIKKIRKTNNKYKYIIFDMVGVLFEINKLGIFSNTGVLDIIWYIIRHRRNPFNTFLETLDNIAKKEEINDYPIKYKNYLQPKCVSEWNRGLKTSIETKKEIREHIQKLTNENYFRSEHEKKVILNMLETISNPKKLTQFASPMNKTIELIQSLKNKEKYKYFLLSNIDSETFTILKDSYEKLFSYFDGIVLSCKTQLLKPNHSIYKFLTDTYGLDPKQCIFIDDQQENIDAAQKMGIKGITYKNISYVRQNLEKLGINL